MSTSILDPRAIASVPRLFQIAKDEPQLQRRAKLALRVLLIVFAIGLLAAGAAAVRGHHVMGTTSEVSWGVLIATYVFFAVSSTGLCLVSSLGHVFGFKLFEPITRRAILLAWIMLVLGFGVIASELERPLLLAKLALLSPNPRSPIWWMGMLYGVYFALLSAELFFLLRHDHGRARKAAIPKLLFAVAASSNLGSVFALSHARPYWYGPFVPVYMIVTALVSGTALLALLVYFGDLFANDGNLRPESKPLLEALGKLLVLFLGVLGFTTAWRLIAGVNGEHQHLYQVTQALLSGPLFFSFWFFEIFLGIAVPAIILLSPRRRDPKLIALASSLPIIAMLFIRYNFVYAGQMFSLKPVVGHLGEIINYAPPFKGNVAGFLSYTPSLVEMLIVAGAIAGAILLFTAGARALGLEKEA
jgi:molybdopterin-containing oxidoreductase family membrane subunit